MDEIRQDLNDIIHKAEDNRARRIALWHRQVRTMLMVLLVLALGMGLLIGLFTRSRLHAVSAAYRTRSKYSGTEPKSSSSPSSSCAPPWTPSATESSPATPTDASR